MEIEQRHYDVLVEHLPYEIDMMRAAYAFLRSDQREKIRTAIGPETGLAVFISNTAIEAFWIHARCLLEFFRRTSQAEGRTASAQDFTSKPLEYDLPFEDLEQSINNQICHLNYARFRNPMDKIDGFTMQRVMEAIDRAIAIFQNNLKDDFNKLWTSRPAIRVESVGSPPSATNQIFSISTTASTSLSLNFVTGPRRP